MAGDNANGISSSHRKFLNAHIRAARKTIVIENYLERTRERKKEGDTADSFVRNEKFRERSQPIHFSINWISNERYVIPPNDIAADVQGVRIQESRTLVYR